jgi:predicted Zn finger-like uncharacterized protein
MIAGCPKCAARYRIDRDKLVDGAVRLRCTKCEAVFRVRAPEEPSDPPQPAAPISVPSPAPVAAPAAAPPELKPVAPVAEQAAPPISEPDTPSEPTGPRVLVATPDLDLAKQVGDWLGSAGYTPILVHDGSQAMLEIQRQLPEVAVLAADLPKMFGFQVCEVVQRNESLNHIHVILVGAIHHPDRYRRPPEEIYGADAYIEAPDLPEGLRALLGEAGIGSGEPVASGAPSIEAPAPPPPLEIDPPQSVPSPEPAPVPEPPAIAEPSPAAPEVAPAPAEAPQGVGDGLDEERAKAERLARIIVSDIILYNEDKFTQCVAAGNVAEVLGPDLTEGRGLFEDRIDPRVRGDRDYLMDELIRVARSRGME